MGFLPTVDRAFPGTTEVLRFEAISSVEFATLQDDSVLIVDLAPKDTDDSKEARAQRRDTARKLSARSAALVARKCTRLDGTPRWNDAKALAEECTEGQIDWAASFILRLSAIDGDTTKLAARFPDGAGEAGGVPTP